MAGLLKKIQAKRKHGLFWFSVTHVLGRKGIRIYPYYLLREGMDTFDLPEVKGDIDEYTFDFLDRSDLETLEENDQFKGLKNEFKKRFEKGHKCFCAKYRGQIVACTWFDFEQCQFLDPLFELSKNETCLFGMYTAESHRGKNIAPYLRYRSYEALRKMGRDTFYSISESLNAPAVKFKKKLNAKFLGHYLLIDLFRKWKWNLKIREYKY